MALIIDLESVGKWLGTTAPVTVVLTSLAYLFILSLVWTLTSKLPSASSGPAAQWVNRLVALIGGLCGWAVATAFTPYSNADFSTLESVKAAASAFLSGYVVSKLDRFLELALFQKNASGNDGWERMGLFTATFLVTAIAVFINRLYSIPDVPSGM